LDEVVRCVMWHRIAAPFGVNKTKNYIDPVKLNDYWTMKADESWVKNHGEGFVNSWQAPAVIVRGLERPEVVLRQGDTLQPFVLASRYPNGAIAIVTIGRTIDRNYLTPRVDVTLKVGQNDQPFGIFGYYNSLTIQVSQPKKFSKILAQDLAGTTAEDITQEVVQNGNKFTIPGTVIERVGLSAATAGDKSEPGMVLLFQE